MRSEICPTRLLDMKTSQYYWPSTTQALHYWEPAEPNNRIQVQQSQEMQLMLVTTHVGTIEQFLQSRKKYAPTTSMCDQRCILLSNKNIRQCFSQGVCLQGSIFLMHYDYPIHRYQCYTTLNTIQCSYASKQCLKNFPHVYLKI